jgi:putative hydrolase of the HAD superfamily
LLRAPTPTATHFVQLRRAGWRVGIVTNGMVDNQEGKIRALGLDDLVDAWVISDDVGIRKPDPEIFKILAERLRAPLDGWMVGDSIELDVAGGHGVGLQTAFISAGDAPRSEATIEVRSVADAVVAILSSES